MQEHLIGRHSLLRSLNYRAVFERMATHGPLSRAAVAHELDLSRASVSRLVDGLLSVNLIAEGDRIASRAGRRQILLDVNPQAAVIAGLSIRSQVIRLLLSDLKGTLLMRAEVDRRNDTPEALVEQVRDLILTSRKEIAPDLPIGAVVAGVSGAWNDIEGRVYAAPHLSIFEGANVLALLQQALALDVIGGTITLDNDINYAALGERAYGAARGVNDFFYLSLGSGVGGAAVVDRQLHRGVLGFAGEVGFLPICVDGALQSLESLISYQALARYAEEEGFSKPESGFFAQLEHWDPAAEAIAERVSGYLAIALASIVTILNPQLIVLGGGIGRHGNYWIESIRRRMSDLLPFTPEIVSTALGRDASLRGAVAHGLTLARQALISERLSP